MSSLCVTTSSSHIAVNIITMVKGHGEAATAHRYTKQTRMLEREARTARRTDQQATRKQQQVMPGRTCGPAPLARTQRAPGPVGLGRAACSVVSETLTARRPPPATPPRRHAASPPRRAAEPPRRQATTPPRHRADEPPHRAAPPSPRAERPSRRGTPQRAAESGRRPRSGAAEPPGAAEQSRRRRPSHRAAPSRRAEPPSRAAESSRRPSRAALRHSIPVSLRPQPQPAALGYTSGVERHRAASSAERGGQNLSESRSR